MCAVAGSTADRVYTKGLAEIRSFLDDIGDVDKELKVRQDKYILRASHAVRFVVVILSGWERR